MRTKVVFRNSDEHKAYVNYRHLIPGYGCWGWITWEEVYEEFISEAGNKIQTSLLVWTQF
jgi:hypothetical protein